MTKGIVLMGHGSHREEANDEIRQIARQVADSNPNILHETAFLSLCRPDLSTAVTSLVQQGVDKIIIAPVFLVTGNHIAQDIPELIDQLRVSHPGIEFILARHIGPDPSVAEIVKARIHEASAP